MSWKAWLLGFTAGSVLATYLTLSCAPSGAQSPEVAYALDHAAAYEGISPRCLRNIAWRESRLVPWVDNFQGSDAVGVELKPAYAELAERRVTRDAPLLLWGAVTVEGGVPPQGTTTTEEVPV
jgi:hypothetical protein